MGNYRCPQAVTGGAEDPIRCRASGMLCAHQKWCVMEGRIVLTAQAVRCPGREEDRERAFGTDCAGGRSGAGEATGAETDGQ